MEDGVAVGPPGRVLELDNVDEVDVTLTVELVDTTKFAPGRITGLFGADVDDMSRLFVG